MQLMRIFLWTGNRSSLIFKSTYKVEWNDIVQRTSTGEPRIDDDHDKDDDNDDDDDDDDDKFKFLS